MSAFLVSPVVAFPGRDRFLRFDGCGRWSVDKNKRVCLGVAGASQNSNCSSNSNVEIMKIARKKFTKEISFGSEDKDVSLAKTLLLVAAEDEAFMALNREMDGRSVFNVRKDACLSIESQHEKISGIEEISLSGKTISGWLNELEMIAKEVEAELVLRDIGCHLVEILEAVNAVLFDSKGLKRFPVLVDLKFSYLHTVLSSGCASGTFQGFFKTELVC